MFAIDLTTNNAVIAYNRDDEVYLWSFPWTVVFRDTDNDIIVSIGESGISSDEKTAVFHDLRDNFPNIYDSEIRVEIIIQLLEHIKNFAENYGKIEDPRTCIILPYGYSSDLIESITNGFEQSDLKLHSILNECVASIVYFFETIIHFTKLQTNPYGDLFCFINATMIPITAFLVEYSEVNNNERTFVVKDYYVSSNSDENLPFPDISIPNLKTVIFGDSSLVRPSGKVVDIIESKDKCRVMVGGAMIIGLAKFKSNRTYTIEGAMGFGIQLNNDKFYEIIPKEVLTKQMPISQSKAFSIKNISHDININLLCGFSNRIASSVKLGTIPLMESWFPQKNGEIVVSIELVSMHRGKFSVTLSQTNVDPIVKEFNVPGWLG
ncbi:MAG: hypothetical protein ACPL7B_06215 [Candidatus Poribacteria bacterium]